MKILFIPLQREADSTERLSMLITILSDAHTVVGVKQKAWFGTSNTFTRYIKFFGYSVQMVFYGLKEPDLDRVFCVHEWYCVLGIIISKIRKRPLIWDNHSGRVNYGYRERSLTNTIDNLLQKRVGRFADRIIVPTEVDRQKFLEEKYAPNRVVFIPTSADFSLVDRLGNDVKAKQYLKDRFSLSEDCKKIIFMGTRLYPPNREAAMWVNDLLAPTLRDYGDHFRIIIAGAGEIPKKIDSNVTFTGFLPNIQALIAISDLAVVPVWRGIGILSKVIDFMAHGKPTVVTPFALRGIPELKDGYNTLIAQSEPEFIQKTILLMTDIKLAERIGKAGRVMVENHYNWASWEEILMETMRDPKGRSPCQPLKKS